MGRGSDPTSSVGMDIPSPSPRWGGPESRPTSLPLSDTSAAPDRRQGGMSAPRDQRHGADGDEAETDDREQPERHPRRPLVERDGVGLELVVDVGLDLLRDA